MRQPLSDRVSERRRAARLARHYRDQENLPIAEIARRLGRAEAITKGLEIARGANAGFGATRAAHSACVGHKVAPWPKQGTGAFAGPGVKLGEEARRASGRRHTGIT